MSIFRGLSWCVILSDKTIIFLPYFPRMTSSRTTCPLFIHTLSFEGTTNRAHNDLNQNFKGLYC